MGGAESSTAGQSSDALPQFCPICSEPAHPRFSNTMLCGLGRCPVAKYGGKCMACFQKIIKGVDHIAMANGHWFHKPCAVDILHPRYLSVPDLVARALSYTTDYTFRRVITSFLEGQGHYILACAPGAGKTTIAAMLAKAIGPSQTINIMFNKHNAIDAIAKGIHLSFTYHSLACSALLRYLRQEVSAYAELGEEGFSMNEDSQLLNAILWTLHPPPIAANVKRDLVGQETRTSVASARYALFSTVINTAINLGMQCCVGITVRTSCHALLAAFLYSWLAGIVCAGARLCIGQRARRQDSVGSSVHRVLLVR